MTRARGFAPVRFTAAPDITTTAEAPSFSPGAFAAVTVPSFWKAGRSLPRDSRVESARGRSSTQKHLGSPFFCGTSTGTISSANLPSFWAFTAFWWLSTEKRS